MAAILAREHRGSNFLCLFLPLLDGAESSLPDDDWQGFEGTWDAAR